LCSEALSEWFRGDERLELGNQLQVTPEGELRLDPPLERDESDLLQPLDRNGCEGLAGEIRQRLSAPEAKRLPKELGGLPRFASAECSAGIFGEASKRVRSSPSGSSRST
jgi:hypothetical protein